MQIHWRQSWILWVVWVVWEALQWHAVANLGEAVNRALQAWKLTRHLADGHLGRNWCCHGYSVWSSIVSVCTGVWSGHADGYHRGDGCLVPCLAKYSSLRDGCTLWQDAAKHAASPAAMAVAITKPNGCHKIGYGHQTHNSRDSKTHHIYIYRLIKVVWHLFINIIPIYISLTFPSLIGGKTIPPKKRRVLKVPPTPASLQDSLGRFRPGRAFGWCFFAGRFSGRWFSKIFYFHPYLGKSSNLTHIFLNGLKPPY